MFSLHIWIYLIHRPEVNGMYSLVCLLFILRTALSLANYGLLLYAFNQTNSNGLNGFLNHFDDYVFDVKKLNQLVGYIQNMIVLYVWSYLILRTSFTFISFFCIAVNAYIFLAVPLYHGWLAFKEHKIDQIKIDSLKVFNRETFSANYRKKIYSQNTTIHDQLAQDGEENINRAFEEINKDWYIQKKKKKYFRIFFLIFFFLYNSNCYSCAICRHELASRKSRITVCDHVFHESCLRKWSNYKDACPMCRQNCFTLFTNQEIQNEIDLY